MSSTNTQEKITVVAAISDKMPSAREYLNDKSITLEGEMAAAFKKLFAAKRVGCRMSEFDPSVLEILEQRVDDLGISHDTWRGDDGDLWLQLRFLNIYDVSFVEDVH